jgi:hypothetical protein
MTEVHFGPKNILTTFFKASSVEDACNPSIQEAEAGGFRSSKPAEAIQQDLVSKIPPIFFMLAQQLTTVVPATQRQRQEDPLSPGAPARRLFKLHL